jgi:hypothetical protein
VPIRNIEHTVYQQEEQIDAVGNQQHRDLTLATDIGEQIDHRAV